MNRKFYILHKHIYIYITLGISFVRFLDGGIKILGLLAGDNNKKNILKFKFATLKQSLNLIIRSTTARI